MVLSRAGLWSVQHHRFARCLDIAGLHLDYGRHFGRVPLSRVIETQPPPLNRRQNHSSRRAATTRLLLECGVPRRRCDASDCKGHRYSLARVAGARRAGQVANA